MEEPLIEIDLSPVVHPFVMPHDQFEGEQFPPEENFVKLQKFISNQIARGEDAHKKHEQYQHPDPLRVTADQVMNLKARAYFAKEAENEIYTFAKQSINQMIELASSLINVLRQRQDLYVDATGFVNNMKDRIREHKRYQHFLFMRRSLKLSIIQISQQYQAPNYLSKARQELYSCFFQFDADLQYSAPSLLEDYLLEYLIRSPYRPMLTACAHVLCEGSIKSSLVTLAELAESVMENFSTDNVNNRTIIYHSLVRIIFDIAYRIRGELNCFNQANMEFLFKCQQFSETTIEESNLPQPVKDLYTAGLPMDSLFRARHLDNVKVLEIITNPIDLMYVIHKTLLNISRYFGASVQLSFSDKSTLLLALIAVAAPVNAVAIARFLHKWKMLQLSQPLGQAARHFISAIEIIYSLEEQNE